MLDPGNIEYATELNKYRNENTHKEDSVENSKEPVLTPIEEPVIITQPILEENKDIKTEAVEESQAPTNEPLTKQGDDAFRKQRYDEALSLYKKAAVINPSDTVTMLKIANIYKLKGDNKKAIDYYDKIILMDKDNTDAYFNKGLVYANDKDYDACIKCFEKVIEISPEYPYAYYSMGMAYELKDMPQKAIEYYHLYSGIESDEKMLDIVKDRIEQLEKGVKE